MPKTVDIDERRQEITDAAARLIARAGLGAATMREVAAEGGWTTGVVTHYFADKRELLLHTLRSSLDRRRARQPERDQLGPVGALRATLMGALPIDEDSRQHWMVTVAFCAQAAGDAELAAAQRDAYRSFRRRVTSLVAASTDAPEPRRVAERLIALTDGVALQALFDPASWPAHRQLAELDRAITSLPPVGGAIR